MYFIYHKYFLQIVFSLNNCPVHQIEHLLNSLNPLRNAELFADKESVGFARNADAELIGGAQRLQIELAAGVDDALCLESEHLQFCIVRCGHQEHTAAAQLFDDGNSQRTGRR